MANMSYCRFENTFHDLQDCYEALDAGEELSKDERRYARRLIQLCRDIVKLDLTDVWEED